MGLLHKTCADATADCTDEEDERKHVPFGEAVAYVLQEQPYPVRKFVWSTKWHSISNAVKNTY